MFLRYSGNGNASPGVLMVATSVPVLGVSPGAGSAGAAVLGEGSRSGSAGAGGLGAGGVGFGLDGLGVTGAGFSVWAGGFFGGGGGRVSPARGVGRAFPAP